MAKKFAFNTILKKIEKITKSPEDNNAKLLQISQLLKDRVPYYNWVGFYITDNEKKELYLGPYVGEPTEHTRIPFGRGICGQAVATKKTFVIQDISKQTNYLACSVKVKSEIVVPVFNDKIVIAEIDIDSHEISPFTIEDRKFLEKVAEIIKDLF